jgi:hypothetical protein
MSDPNLQEFIDALGSPEEWAKIPEETLTGIEIEHDEKSRMIIGSVATREEIQAAIDTLGQE